MIEGKHMIIHIWNMAEWNSSIELQLYWPKVSWRLLLTHQYIAEEQQEWSSAKQEHIFLYQNEIFMAMITTASLLCVGKMRRTLCACWGKIQCAWSSLSPWDRASTFWRRGCRAVPWWGFSTWLSSPPPCPSGPTRGRPGWSCSSGRSVWSWSCGCRTWPSTPAWRGQCRSPYGICIFL